MTRLLIVEDQAALARALARALTRLSPELEVRTRSRLYSPGMEIEFRSTFGEPENSVVNALPPAIRQSMLSNAPHAWLGAK